MHNPTALTPLQSGLPRSLLWIPRSTVTDLLQHYDYPHPHKPGKIIKGYDKAHALRTAKMSATVAHHLGHDQDRIRLYQISCLLHDLGRAGLDKKLFGTIWSWAKTQGIPTRPAEWRACYPDTQYGKETEAFWRLFKPKLQELGLQPVLWTKEQVEMRLGFARRMRRLIKQAKPKMLQHDIRWYAWMEKVTLYYYYPEKLADSPAWVRELGEILVACEQLEAYSNRDRGNDYYNRADESFVEAFDYLENLKLNGQISKKVLSAVRYLTSQGLFDSILKAARKRQLTKQELCFLRSL